MKPVYIIALAGLLMVYPSAYAAFIASDFQLSAEAFDAEDPVPPAGGRFYGASFSISLTNFSDEAAISGQNIFPRGSA
jgi:hypothetical protein